MRLLPFPFNVWQNNSEASERLLVHRLSYSQKCRLFKIPVTFVVDSE